MQKVLGCVAVNDSKKPVTKKINGKKVLVNRAYRYWHNMISRCYNIKSSCRDNCYAGCSVCDDWLTFSNFELWFNGLNPPDGYHLDKDLMKKGNKVYSPDTCVFIPRYLNVFIADEPRGSNMTGAHYHKYSGGFYSRVSNPLTGEIENLGYFKTEIAAHLAWLSRKHELSIELSKTIDDERVVNALKDRYKYPSVKDGE